MKPQKSIKSLSNTSFSITEIEFGGIKSFGTSGKDVVYLTALKLYFKNNNASTFLGNSLIPSFWIDLETLNSLSLAEELWWRAQINFDNFDSSESSSLLILQKFRGFSCSSSLFDLKYLFISLFAISARFGHIPELESESEESSSNIACHFVKKLVHKCLNSYLFYYE